MNHTAPASSRQTSTKWLPLPSVPRCWRLLVFASFGWSRQIASNSGSSCAQAVSTEPGVLLQAPGSRAPGARPCGTARSIAERSGARLSGRSSALQRGLAGHHAAADVDADRGRDDRLQRRDHRADGRADAEVHVGHRRDVLEDDRQARRVVQLALGRVFHRHAARPHLDGHAAAGLLLRCSCVPWLFSPVAPFPAMPRGGTRSADAESRSVKKFRIRRGTRQRPALQRHVGPAYDLLPTSRPRRSSP